MLRKRCCPSIRIGLPVVRMAWSFDSGDWPIRCSRWSYAKMQMISILHTLNNVWIFGVLFNVRPVPLAPSIAFIFRCRQRYGSIFWQPIVVALRFIMGISRVLGKVFVLESETFPRTRLQLLQRCLQIIWNVLRLFKRVFFEPIAVASWDFELLLGVVNLANCILCRPS